VPGIHFVHFPNNAIISLYDGLLVTGTQVSIASGSEIVKHGEFPNPDQFDIYRNPNRHVGFSSGIHYCVGAPLARLEGAIVINTLLRRLPKLRLATEDVQWRENMSLRGLKSLPVTF